MKETKVYVDELPESCSYCPCFDVDNDECNITDCPVDYIGPSVAKPDDCPLIDIKTHDREKDKRIKELEQKVQELQELDNKRAFRLYCMLYDMLEKQDPENVASRIEYMTSKNYADICEMYKTAKNLKQRDRELVKKVLDKVRNDIRPLFKIYASSVLGYCIYNKNADSNQNLYNNFKRIVNDRLEKVLVLFDKEIAQIQKEFEK